MEAPQWADWIGVTLHALPAPTTSWASIIDSLAWPGLLGYLMTRYRRFVKSYLETIADRLQRDHIRIGLFEMTPNSEVIPLDPNSAGESTEDFSAEDLGRIERFFEFISEPSGYASLMEWLNQSRGGTLNVSDFLTTAEYAADREEAAQALFTGES
jgi:hypothetical protein